MADLEKRGLPCVLVSYALPDLVQISADAFLGAGLPGCRQVTCPADTALSDLGPWVPDMVDALTRPLTAEEAASGTYQAPAPPRIAMTGTYDEVMAYYEGDLMATDAGGPWAWMTVGLPVVPPTEERVAMMLQGTSHSPDEVIEFGGWGKVPRAATLEKIAANAVMAGCKPEYFPAVLAIAETGACAGYPGDSSFGNMYVVSGPYAKEIGMNSGFCFLESGNPANMALEHACQLMGVNLGNCLHGLNNLERTGSTHWGTTFAENPDTPWDTLNVDLGFESDESVLLYFRSKVTLVPFQNMETKNTTSLEECQPGTPDHIVAGLSTATQQRSGIILFTPDTARWYRDKWGFDSIQEIQDYFWENVVHPAGDWYNNYWFVTHTQRGRYESREPGIRQLNPDHLDLPPDTLIPMFDSPEAITVIVAGGSGDAYTFGFGGPSAISIDKWR